MKRNIFCGFLLCLTLSNFALASDLKDKSELTEVFAGAIQAVGGEKEIGKIKSIEASAICVGPQGEYSTEIISFRSNKTLFKQTFTYREKDTNIFINGKTVWEQFTGTNDFAIASPFQRLIVQLHEYQKMAFDFQKMFTDFELIGEENFNDRASVKVKAINDLGGTIYLYFDRETNLLAGYVLPIPGSNEAVKNVFNEYTSIGKLKMPSKVTATDSSGDWILHFNKITINQSDEKILEIPPQVEDLAELLKFYKQSETAHLTYNAEMLVETFHENGITEVNRGEVSILTKQKGLERFRSYFRRVRFLEWADIKPPIINISDDRTLATIIVQKRVRSVPKNDRDEKNLRHFEFAWLEVWRKSKGRWKLISVISTDKLIDNK